MGKIAAQLHAAPPHRKRPGFSCALSAALAPLDDEDRDAVWKVMLDPFRSDQNRAALLSEVLGIHITNQTAARHRTGACRTCADG